MFSVFLFFIGQKQFFSVYFQVFVSLFSFLIIHSEMAKKKEKKKHHLNITFPLFVLSFSTSKNVKLLEYYSEIELKNTRNKEKENKKDFCMKLKSWVELRRAKTLKQKHKHLIKLRFSDPLLYFTLTYL